MAIAQKGQIIFRNRARQIKDFSGLLFGNITPTDIDGLIEYHGRAYVIIELKFNDRQVPFGQKLALERLTDDLEKAGKQSLCIIAKHNTINPRDAIDVANATVSEYRFRLQWRNDNTGTVKNLVKRFLELHE